MPFRQTQSEPVEGQRGEPTWHGGESGEEGRRAYTGSIDVGIWPHFTQIVNATTIDHFEMLSSNL